MKKLFNFAALRCTSLHFAIKTILLASIFLNATIGFSQNLFTITSQPTAMNVSQTKMLTKTIASPHIGDIKFVQFPSTGSIIQNTNISFSIPSVNNGNVMVFEISDAIFDNPAHYSIQAKNSTGYVSVYVTPEGVGATIDLVTRQFVIYPLGNSKGLLTEHDLNEVGADCSNSKDKPTEGTGAASFCSGDCGTSILDVLIMRTPEANTWLTTTYGNLAEWFLFAEGNNMNLALANSLIAGKRIRVRTVNYTPEFDWSTLPTGGERITADLNALTSSTTAINLLNQFQADIGVLLTDRDYLTVAGRANSLDPMSSNKFVIAEVPFIDPSRYTLAHEIGHQLGCMHSSVADNSTCPFGTFMGAIGRNTVMGDQNPNPNTIGALANSRIPFYSNPLVSFAGIPTGTVGTRNNAQQIMSAFCESANNAPDARFITITKETIGPVCAGEKITFSANVVGTNWCYDAIGLPIFCGLPPYQHEWRRSNNPQFTNSQVLIGTSNTVNIEISDPCVSFYLRYTVTSSTGEVNSETKYVGCSVGYACDRTISVTELKVIPNPAHDEFKIVGINTDFIQDIQCFSIEGKKLNLLPFDILEEGQISISTTNLAPGVYIFKVYNGMKFETLKVIIQ